MKGINLTLILLIIGHFLIADIRLPQLISHGLVLQRDATTKIWGWADPNEEIDATINTQTYSTTTTSDGRWEIQLPAFPAGGPYSLHLKGHNEIAVHNILFGDVWLCSGQSNMELPIRRVLDRYKDEVLKTYNEQIRTFHIPTTYKFGMPLDNTSQSKWISINPSTAMQMSAVAYFFALDLYARYKVPIGLIVNAVGGSPAEAWLSNETIKEYPKHYTEQQKYINPNIVDSIKKQESEQQRIWHQQTDTQDLGLINNWQYGAAPAKWKSVDLPVAWNSTWFPELPQSVEKITGSVWFKKDIELNGIDRNTTIRLDLGTIVDADDVYINGYPIGSTAYQYPPRIYYFSPTLLQEGINTITIRMRSYGGNGEFVADKPYALTVGNQRIDLKENWKYHLGYYNTTPIPGSTTFHYKPSTLYNALLYPLKELKLKGVIWYQGESNTRDPQEYKALFTDLINDWRALFNQPKLPFLYVQLANFMKDGDEPIESNWAETRQVQLEALRIPYTAMATIIDLGEWNDIHPLNKKDVGIRLALAAKKLTYGEDIIYSGPLYHSYKIENNKIYIYFEQAGSGLALRDDNSLKHFAIADERGKFHWAKAEIHNDHIVVWNDKVVKPTAVRYAWGNNPKTANLINKEGLPASPFTTK